MADCDCTCHLGGAYATCSIDDGCWANHRDDQPDGDTEQKCGLRCARPDGPCPRCIALTEHDLAALDPLHDRLGADHDGALVPRPGRQPVMRALNLRGPGARGSVKIRLVPVWRTRKDQPKICAGEIRIGDRPDFMLPVPWPAWIREPVIDELTGQQKIVEDGDQSGETPIPALLDDWVRDCRRTLHLASWPKSTAVADTVSWLSIQLQRWLDAHPDPIELCEEIRRAAHSARNVLDDYEPWPTRAPEARCPRCGLLDLWLSPDEESLECGSCDPALILRGEEMTDVLAAAALTIGRVENNSRAS